MQLTAHAVVFLLRPHRLGAHAGERLARRLDGAGEHETDRLKQRDGAGLELSVLAPNGGLADVARDQVHAFHLRDRNPERLRDRGFDQAFAEADAHLAGDDLDEESSGLGVQPPEQSFERSGLGGATRSPDRFERPLDLLEGYRLRLRAAVERFSSPVAEVRVLAEDAPELFLVAARDRGHNLAQRRPAEAERAALRRRKSSPAQVDGGTPEILVGQRAEVGGENPRLLEGGGRCADGCAGAGELKQGDLS